MKNLDLKNTSYQHYIQSDFLTTLFFNKRIPLLVSGITDGKAVGQKLLDAYGNVKVIVAIDENEFEWNMYWNEEGEE